jgi:uncharacterized membrane protein
MTTNSNQGQQPDAPESYGGYTGYRPSNPVDDPYGSSQQGGSQESDPNYVYGQHTQGQQSSDSQTQQQQQFSYEPPESVLRKQRKRSSGSSTPFTSAASQGPVTKDDRKAALYSYLGFCFTGIAFFFLKGKRPFVRFHAAQSIVLFVPVAAILAVLKIVSIITLIPFIGWLLAPVISLLTFIVVAPVFILWIALMVLSYQGIRVKLPIIGHYAEALVARFSSDKSTV